MRLTFLLIEFFSTKLKRYSFSFVLNCIVKYSKNALKKKRILLNELVAGTEKNHENLSTYYPNNLKHKLIKGLLTTFVIVIDSTVLKKSLHFSRILI